MSLSFKYLQFWSLSILVCTGHQIPDSLKNAEIPAFMVNPLENEDFNDVVFEIPVSAKRRLLSDPREILHGACLETYRGYASNARMAEIQAMLGVDTYDMIIEYAMYDYLTGDCTWLQEVWGSTRDDWSYVQEQHSGIFKDLQTSLIKEIGGWLEWWINTHQDENAVIYSDEDMEWKMRAATLFVCLKKSSYLHTPSPEPQPSLDSSEDENGGRGPGKGRGGQVHCHRINPVKYFGDRYETIVNWLKNYKESDISHPGVGQERGLPKPNPNGYTSQLNIFGETCLGLCMRLGAGLTWNAQDGSIYIHWIYGLGQTADFGNNEPCYGPTSVRVQVAIFCESSVAWADSHHWSLVPGEYPMDDSDDQILVGDENSAFGLIYNQDEEFLGISFEKGWDLPYAMDFSESHRFQFYYYHSERFAVYSPPPEEVSQRETGEENLKKIKMIKEKAETKENDIGNVGKKQPVMEAQVGEKTNPYGLAIGNPNDKGEYENQAYGLAIPNPNGAGDPKLQAPPVKNGQTGYGISVSVPQAPPQKGGSGYGLKEISSITGRVSHSHASHHHTFWIALVALALAMVFIRFFLNRVAKTSVPSIIRSLLSAPKDEEEAHSQSISMMEPHAPSDIFDYALID